jgi:uncharacterized damage-inducible protein DinB
MIDTFAAGGRELTDAIRGLTHEELLATPGPGEWSIQQLVVHLGDSDAIAIDRMKRIIAEDNPTLLYADESAYVRELFCDQQSVEDTVLLFEVGRRQFARVLRNLPDTSFERYGTHSRRGRVTLGGLVADYIEHLEHHLKFIYAKRERLGNPVASGGNRVTCNHRPPRRTGAE